MTAEYQINNLYSLLLIDRGCPWDDPRNIKINLELAAKDIV